MFDTPTFEDIRSAILRDTLSLDPSADVSADSDHYVHASRLASCAVGQYAHQHWIVRQMFPDTADAAYLERHAGLRGLRRRSPTAAAGTAAVRGTANAAVTVGAQIRAGNRFSRVTEAACIGSAGTATVRIAAVDSDTRKIDFVLESQLNPNEVKKSPHSSTQTAKKPQISAKSAERNNVSQRSSAKRSSNGKKNKRS